MKRIIILLACVPISATAADLVADGELCLSSPQCASGVCLRKDATSLARCAPKAQQGEACSFVDTLTGVYYNPPCETGLACKADASATTGNFGVCGKIELLEECPTGHISIDAPYITIATSCPSGTTAIGTAESCLATLNGNCIMYAPAGVSFTDDAGTYEFTASCALE
ncbi:MAG: hypothetical protein J6L70_01645 [Alphaproteobacteria bacterium]|nr:hypothetical protein [Alphaproteobacteria bacterium]